jgi:hypothetical protein
LHDKSALRGENMNDEVLACTQCGNGHHLSDIEKIQALEEKLKIAVQALKSIKQENLDGKTPERYIKALQQWKNKTTRTSWNALIMMGIDPLKK